MTAASEPRTDARAVIWMIAAIIQPFRLDAVVLALEAIEGFGGMTVSECCGFGREKAIEGRGCGVPAQSGVVDFTKKTKLEIVAGSEVHAAEIVDVIARTAHTGNRGDGKIFSWPVSRVVRVRTFEEGATAL